MHRVIELLDVCGIDSINKNKPESRIFFATARHNSSQISIMLFDKLYQAYQKSLIDDAMFYLYLQPIFQDNFGCQPVYLDRRGLTDCEKNEGMILALQSALSNQNTSVKLDSSSVKFNITNTYCSEMGDTIKLLNQGDKNYLLYKRREPYENIYAVEKTVFDLHPLSSGVGFKFLNPYNSNIYFILKNGNLGLYDSNIKKYLHGFQKIK